MGFYRTVFSLKRAARFFFYCQNIMDDMSIRDRLRQKEQIVFCIFPVSSIVMRAGEFCGKDFLKSLLCREEKLLSLRVKTMKHRKT
ncbi:MAG: hypothetical protein K2H52_15275 [Lachnospiraceae bacterium]|nr:hypothetical protein [Lachnospiraceae bacterium]